LRRLAARCGTARIAEGPGGRDSLARMNSAAREPDPETRLGAFLARFDAAHQKLIRTLRTALRRRLPSANELAYDYPDSIVVSYSATQHAIDAVLALSVRAEGVRLYLMNSGKLADPNRLLQGSGNLARFVAIPSTGVWKSAAVQDLVAGALAAAKVAQPAVGKGILVIRSDEKVRAARRPTKKTCAQSSTARVERPLNGRRTPASATTGMRGVDSGAHR
jgi:hypothetical protein